MTNIDKDGLESSYNDAYERGYREGEEGTWAGILARFQDEFDGLDDVGDIQTLIERLKAAQPGTNEIAGKTV